MSVNDFLKSLQFRSSNATKRRKQRTAQLASRQVVAAEAVESRMLLTPVLALNPVSGLEGDTTHFDGQFSGVTPGNQYTIDVNWGDGSAIQQISGVAVGGGLDKFSVSHNYGDNGAYSISAKLTESPLIIGADAIYVIDVSGSTQTLLAGPSIGDVNMDGRSNSVLDLEIAGFMALNNDLVARGLGNISKVSLVSFDATARTVDLNPAMAGVQAWTTPLADNDHNGVRDVDQALRTLRSLGGTNFEAALQTTISVAIQVGTPPGQGNVVLLSDGMSQSVAFGDEAGVLRGPLGMNVRAFGVGASANLNQLQQIDPLATTFVNTNQLLSTFSGSGTVGGGIATASVMGHIFNVAPTVSGLVIDPIIDESGTATLVGSFIDPGAFDSHTIEIAWGDGAVESITLAAGQRTFAVPHQYINQVTTPIYVTLRDVDGGSSSSQTQIQVMNVSPEILTATVNSAADNGGIATLFVEFSDPGTVDLHTVQVQWGDGTSDVLTLPAGERTVSLAHDYIGATLASSIANIRVSVADETLAESVQFLQTLVNVAPTVSIVSLTPTID